MNVDSVIYLIEKFLAYIELGRHRHILEGTAPFYAGAEYSLDIVLILLRSIKSQSPK